jgi:hypothetical protein
MIRILIEVQGDTARQAQGELETTLEQHGFVRQEQSYGRLYHELVDALRSADVDVRAMVDRYRAERLAAVFNAPKG